tara:strand:- start:10146 stop:10439 length:294 start_codon:yes stop_codon:yes gene_type:complete
MKNIVLSSILVFSYLISLSRPTVILEISYTHPIEVDYWKRLTEDSTFNTMYELVMVESHKDCLTLKDIHTDKVLGTLIGRPNLKFLIELYNKEFKII